MQGLPQGAQGQQANLAAQLAAGATIARLADGRIVLLPPGAAAGLMQQQQQQQNALLMQQQMGQMNPAMLGAVRPGQQGLSTAQQASAAQLAAVSALQQRMQVPGAAGQQGAAAAAGNPAALAALRQQQQLALVALQQRQQRQQQQQAAAAVRPAAAVAPAEPAMGFTQEQLLVLKEQIMLFKTVKKGSEVTKESLDKCKPPPLPPPALPQQQALVAPLGGGVRPAGMTALQQHIRPPAAAAMAAAQQQQLQQQQLQAAQLQAAAAAQQQQQQQQQQRAAQAQAQQRGAAAGRAAGQAAAAAQAEAQTGPSTPPMDMPVRRWAGPLLGMLPPAELPPGAGPPPSLNVDVPRMLLREYHHRAGRSRARRQQQLEQLLRRSDLPVGHTRSPEGLPGRAAVLLELRKLRLWAVQAKVRATLEREQEEICLMQDRNYRQLAKTAAKYKQTLDLQVQQRQHEKWERLFIERVQYKKVVADRLIMFRDMHLRRNNQLARLHERLARELNRQRMDDNDRRLEALKANDFEAYKELLKQTYGPLSDDDRFAEVERFLQETEEYINKLTKKLVQYKAEEQAGEAVQEAITEARMLELSEEEVKARAAAAQQEHMASNDLLTQVHTLGGDAQSRFTQLAHNIREKVTRQPAYLKPPKAGKLREYQMVGLEWMVSLYNNKLNGILADEMGLGKTVQVMALLAYLYEFKHNYGPHLIIVPNAVIVNWKAELQMWLPDFRCVYYTGSKEERAVKFQNEVQSMQFNILVTTYETIMRDRSKLSKLSWKYIIIDEAQRMKDRESKLSQDLNKFTTARRLLLTGTPLQNELKELWSLLNLLLPDVFNDSNTFSEWFTRFLGVDTFGDGPNAPGGGPSDAAALDREKKILVVNRLHQILSPFMLRRMVKDVEQQLPEKVTVTIKCPMSAYQSAVYNWIKTTNTIRVDPRHRRAAHGQRAWEPLQNKVMELRKVCNHPRLCYPDTEHFWGNDVVRTCGKMFWLDRMLVKLYASGHRVLLFSTMTKMLDTVEFYLNWRVVDARDGSGQKVLMQSRRIDGGTTLDAREAAIQEFNRPDTDVFIFLLSIRAAGRGLNLQSSDTVIIYDPDPNPKNEEQAIARSHRIGQTKEVRVFHLEAISDPADSFPPHYYQPRRGDSEQQQQQQQEASQPQQPQQQQGAPTMFADSIESLTRNILQKQKIDMANEVIDAGRFDMQTTNEERRKTLEEMLLDEDRLQTATNEAPTLDGFNKQLARGHAEYELFTRLDREAHWPGELYTPQEVPEYLRYSADEAQEVLTITDRRPARLGMLATAERRAQNLAGGPDAAQQQGSGRGRGRGRGRGGMPPKPSRLGAAAPAAAAAAAGGLTEADLAGAAAASGATAGGSMRPSQSMGSFLGATSYVSGMGEEGEGDEEVVGGVRVYEEDIEEEVVDDRNIDEEFEQALEQAEVPQAAGAGQQLQVAAAASAGSLQQQQQQQQEVKQEAVPAAAPALLGAAGAAAAGGYGAGSVVPGPAAAAPPGAVPAAGSGLQQQQQQQQQHVKQEAAVLPDVQHVKFEDAAHVKVEQSNHIQGSVAAAPVQMPARPAAAAAAEEDDWEDVDDAPAVPAAAAPAAAPGLGGFGSLLPGQAGAALNTAAGQRPPWQQQQQQTAAGLGAPGHDAAAGAGTKRSWGDMAAGPAGGAAAPGGAAVGGGVWPAVSAGQATSSGMPSSSPGGSKKVRLKLKGMGSPAGGGSAGQQQQHPGQQQQHPGQQQQQQQQGE